MNRGEDPAALRSALAVRFFATVFTRRLSRGFAAVRIARADGDDAGDTDPERSSPFPRGLRERLAGRPVVLYCNHPSWWDAMLLALVAQRLLPGQPFYAPIDAAALDRYRFMRRCGAFGVEPGTHAGARALLRSGGDLLAVGAATLCITPQGAFSDARRRPLQLRRGLAALLARAPQAVALPMAIEYPFWDESRPEALLRFGAPVVAGGPDASHAADARGANRDLHDRVTRALETAMDRLADDAGARDPARFRTLLSGRVGSGAVYDGWQRLRAAVAGRRFDPAHGALHR